MAESDGVRALIAYLHACLDELVEDELVLSRYISLTPTAITTMHLRPTARQYETCPECSYEILVEKSACLCSVCQDTLFFVRHHLKPGVFTEEFCPGSGRAAKSQGAATPGPRKTETGAK